MERIVPFFLLLSMAHASIIAYVPATSQYHTQDTFGQYSFGYSGGPSSQHEVKTLDGITQGSYAYVDANNILQTVSYVSDPVNGFRVAATNLPQQEQAFIAPTIATEAHIEPIATPEPTSQPEPIPEIKSIETPETNRIPEDTAEVKAAREAHLKAHEEATAAALSRSRRSAILAPLTYIYTPVVSHQYGVQDNFGQYTYGYSDNLSAKSESRSIDGVTKGSYSYIDGNGEVQIVSYVADDHGFRVIASNLPEGPKSIDAPAFVLPVAPEETPEVKAAREAHLKAHEDASKN